MSIITYRKEYALQAYKLCLLGCTEKELANFFCIPVSVFRKWLKEHDELSHSVKEGMQLADAVVAERLYQKATGFSHESTVIKEEGKSEKTTYKNYPPDTAAAIFWLKNRQPEKWGKREDEITEQTIDVKVED